MLFFPLPLPRLALGGVSKGGMGESELSAASGG